MYYLLPNKTNISSSCTPSSQISGISRVKYMNIHAEWDEEKNLMWIQIRFRCCFMELLPIFWALGIWGL